MKYTYLFLIVQLLSFNIMLFADESDDKQVYFKFRGNLSLVADYMTEYKDGVKADNRIMPVSYEGIDTRGGDSKYKTTGDPGRLIGGSWGGVQAKLYVNYSIIAMLPFFNNSLMQDSNIKFTFNAEVSPLTMNVGTTITYTPIAFLVLTTGLLIGPGWQVNDELAGIGINRNGIIDRQSFGGPLLQQWFSLTFQMDLAYVLPEALRKWTHIVFLGTTTIKYQGLLGVDRNQPYMYEECPGEQLGGWRFIADALLGYRFYFIEDNDFDKGTFIKKDNKNLIFTAGMYIWLDYLDISHYNDSPMSNGWGSDFAFLNFGPAVQIDLPYNFYIKLFAFFRNDKAYTNETVGNRDFRDRKYDDYNVFFRWAGGFIGWNF